MPVPDVSFFIHNLAGGGAERVATLLANEFHRRGLVVEMVLHHKDGVHLNTLDPAIPIVELGGRLRWLPIPFARYLRRQRPRSVFSFINTLNIAAILGKQLSRWNGYLVISERVAVDGTLREPRGWLVLGLMRLLYRRAHRVVAVSEALANDLRVRKIAGADMILHVPNPLDVGMLNCRVEQPVNHPFIGDSNPLVVAAGRLTYQKGFDVLIRAVSRVRNQREVNLLILGEGPERVNLELLIDEMGLSDAVDMPGFVVNPYPFIGNASVFVLSSRYEGWPNVLGEALALGRSIVATDCPTGPRELLSDGKLGRLVPVDDEVAVANGIVELLEQPFDGSLLRARANAWTLVRVADQYLDIVAITSTEQHR